MSQFLWDEDLIEPAVDRQDRYNDDGSTLRRLNTFEQDGYRNWVHVRLFEILGERFRLCLKSGATVRFEATLLYWTAGTAENYQLLKAGKPFPKKFDERRRLSEVSFEFIDTSLGIVSNNLPSWLDHAAPLAGLPLCINERDFPVPLEEMPKWLFHKYPETHAKRRSQSRAFQARDLGQDIVDAFDSGKCATKADAKDLFGRAMKTAEWQAHWVAACEIRPSLKRPGPRRR